MLLRKTRLRRARSIGHLDLLVIVLSVYVLGILAIGSLFWLRPEVSQLLREIDLFICIFFRADFRARYYYSAYSAEYAWSWVGLVGSIPAIDPLCVGRLPPLLRLLRNRRQGAFLTAVKIAIIMVTVSSTAILEVEKSPRSQIRVAEGARQWAYATITIGGYGDLYPVTTAGCLVGAVLMTGGVGLFTALAALISSWFLQPGLDDEAA